MVPMVSATCGVPPVVVTVTGSLKEIVTMISSPAMKVGVPAKRPCATSAMASPVTVGEAVSAADPVTVKALSSLTAWAPRPSAAAFPAASRIAAPPGSVSAEAPMATPFGSASPVTTA